MAAHKDEVYGEEDPKGIGGRTTGQKKKIIKMRGENLTSIYCSVISVRPINRILLCLSLGFIMRIGGGMYDKCGERDKS